MSFGYFVPKLKDIPGYEGLYGITHEGNVYSHRRGKWMIPQPINSQGYLAVQLSDQKGDVKSYLVSRLVAMTYLPKPHDGCDTVHHIDHNIQNNSVENLEWINADDHKELHRIARRKVICVETGTLYDSLYEAAKSVSGNAANISKVCYHKRPSYKGFTWRFINED